MRYLTIIALLLIAGSVSSQTGRQLQYRFQHLTQRDGLSGNHVMFITQDDNGYIWIATLLDGIQRYDGVRFEQFGEEFLDSSTNISHVSALTFWRGDLIAQSNLNDYKYHRFHKRFLPHKAAPTPASSFTDEQDNVWKIDEESIVQTARKSGNLILQQRFYHRLTETNSALLYDSVSRQYWFAGAGGFLLFDVRSGKAIELIKTPHRRFAELLHKESMSVSNMLLDRNGNLWLSTWSGKLYRYNVRTMAIKSYPLKFKGDNGTNATGPLGVNLFYIDRHKQLWVSTYGAGLMKYDSLRDHFDYVLPDKSDVQGLWYNYEVKTIFQDSDDNIWLGTDMGISVFNPYRNTFAVVKHHRNNRHSLAPYEIAGAIQLRNRDIWIGTWGGGINVLDSNLAIREHFIFDQPKENLVWSFAEDDRHRIWIGCQHGIIKRYNQTSKTFEKPFAIPGNKSTITAMQRDTRGNIYFGMHNGGIAKWTDHTGTFTMNLADTAVKRSPIFQIYIDNNGYLWATDVRYLYKLDAASLERLDSFDLTTPARQTPAAISIGFYPQNDSIFIISSMNGSPGYLNIRSGTFTGWNIKDEIKRKRISTIKQDKTGRIWFTAGWGLYEFDPEKGGKVYSYSTGDGLISSPFDRPVNLDFSDGRWAFFTSTEIVVFDPLSLERSNSVDDRVQIIGFRMPDKEVLIDSLLEHRRPLRLAHNQNFFTIEFSPMTFFPAQKTGYQYRLAGINQDWVTADDNYAASYTKLRPGRYEFQVKPEHDEQNEQVASLVIIISPPFWQTWWFYSICVMTLAFMVWWVLTRRIQAVRRKAGLEQKILETEMAALRAQMNPHFIFNCISAIDSLIQNGERDKATTYLARFAKLIRNVLDSSKNHVVPFYKDYETTKLFIDLERFRSSEQFEYKLHADQELMDGDYKVPPLLMQPFIENAIRHGLFNKTEGAKYLDVSIRLDNEVIIYTISDNGVGRDRAGELKLINRPEHESYGIQISKKRIRQFNKSGSILQKTADDLIITDLFTNDKPAGTQVQIMLKVNTFP